MNKNATLVFHPDNSSLNNTEHTDIPELDTQTANQLLGNVFAACDMEPSVVPVEVLESWGNYKKHDFNLGRTLAYIFLIVLILLPLMFFRPSIIAERTDVKSASDAIYSIHIKTLLPLHSVSATINGTPVRLQEEGSKEFKAAVSDNGTLKITDEEVKQGGYRNKREAALYKGIKFLKHAIELHPRYVNGYLNLGLAHFKLRKDFEALYYWKMAERLYPNNPYLRNYYMVYYNDYRITQNRKMLFMSCVRFVFVFYSILKRLGDKGRVVVFNFNSIVHKTTKVDYSFGYSA